MNKKAISTIVSTMLVIAISITLALTIGSIVKAVPDKLLSPALTCTELSLSSPLSIKDASYNENTQELQVLVERKLGSLELTEFSFSLTNTGDIQQWACGPTCGGCTLPESGTSKLYFFSTEKLSNAHVSIKVNDCVLDSRAIS
jgi:hypothetical protein